MKRTFFVLLLLSGLVGGSLWFGLNRAGQSAALSEDTKEKLVMAEALLENGDPTATLKVIDGLKEEGITLNESSQLLYMKALSGASRYESAKEVANAFLQEFPESESKLDAEVIRLTSELRTSGMIDPSLRKSVEDFVDKHPDHKATTKLHIALAKQDLQLGDSAAAQRRLGDALSGSVDFGGEAFEVAQALGEANLEKLYSSALSEGDIQYTVESGNTINGIARNHGVTEELLMTCNGIDNPRLLRVGQDLKVPNVDFSLHVDIGANTMELRNHGDFFKVYRVRTGREAGTTPTGSFKILNKKRNPTWRPGNGDVYKPGDPNNELGTRWMAFDGDILGIHGTLHPETVGHYASNGCIGMHTEDVEELFNLITVGTPLLIKGERDTNRHRVIEADPLEPPMSVASN